MLSKKDTDPTEVHSHCVFLTKDKLYTMLAAMFIWYNYIGYIMQCSNNDEEPSKNEAL